MSSSLRDEIAGILYAELSDGPEGEVHPYDERWYRATDRILALEEILNGRAMLAAAGKIFPTVASEQDNDPSISTHSDDQD